VEVCIIQKKYQKGNPDADCLFGTRVDLITTGSNQIAGDLEAFVNMRFTFRFLSLFLKGT
jgi:hypothetical protein